MRIAMGIEYDGTAYLGWQRLSHGPSVQTVVEKALSFVANEPIEVTCSGRTDSGVHALCQVIHFDTNSTRTMYSWVMGGCSNLPPDVAVLWAQPMPEDFHARFDARARRYRYTILNRSVRPALDARFVTWERRPLDAESMHQSAQILLGENDFTSFRAISCQARHPWRNIHAISVWREGARVMIEVEANAFLHHMVRNIVGSLLLIGRGEANADWLASVFHARNRDLAGPTAPASGLTFVGARYPSKHELPQTVTMV